MESLDNLNSGRHCLLMQIKQFYWNSELQLPRIFWNILRLLLKVHNELHFLNVILVASDGEYQGYHLPRWRPQKFTSFGIQKQSRKKTQKVKNNLMGLFGFCMGYGIGRNLREYTNIAACRF